ncbi:putative transcriptional regulator [Actinokineospora baliensis]|uniref:BlaI/MecI/CopY family transcriptional regulator n=1 Tax=Actinokineospora baliensis TaxID=547056 RepID=UPI0027DC5148|nr:BlaI/MecI/CopY family transcriptional regulator [Actinokineospora baliensis]MBM7774381.1 putative transcriptional regulator [Actinokineospora baliensis]
MNDEDPSGSPRRKPGELAAHVLNTLAEAGEPLSPGEVLERLDPSGTLSYSAVVTTLTRLHEKKAVTRERSGRAYRYTAVTDPAALIAWRMTRLLDAEPDRTSILTRFVSNLTEKDEKTLRTLLGDTDTPG